MHKTIRELHSWPCPRGRRGISIRTPPHEGLKAPGKGGSGVGIDCSAAPSVEVVRLRSGTLG